VKRRTALIILIALASLAMFTGCQAVKGTLFDQEVAWIDVDEPGTNAPTRLYTTNLVIKPGIQTGLEIARELPTPEAGLIASLIALALAAYTFKQNKDAKEALRKEVARRTRTTKRKRKTTK